VTQCLVCHAVSRHEDWYHDYEQIEDGTGDEVELEEALVGALVGV
jgi:hypothetical protein